jgi:hypothetical protein
MPYFSKTAIDPFNGCEACSVFDVNLDGVPDIVCGEYWYEGPDYTTKHKICGITEDHGYVWDFSDYPLDVNGDGYIDIITGSWWGEGIYWRENPGAAGGEWKTHKIIECANVETIRYFDIDGCGTAEIFPNCPGEPVFFLKFLGNGRFEKHIVGEIKAGHGFGVGDVDGDGLPEILTPKGIWRMKGGDPFCGLWDFTEVPEFGGTLSVPMLVYDVNGDGVPDVIAGHAHHYGLYWFEQTRNADGSVSWTKHAIDNAWSQYHDMQLADIDGDGELELITGKRWKAHNGRDPGDDGEVFVCYYKFRDGRFYRHMIDFGSAERGHSGVGIYFWLADLDGNGKPDVVAPGKEGLYLFRNV